MWSSERFSLVLLRKALAFKKYALVAPEDARMQLAYTILPENYPLNRCMLLLKESANA